MNRPRLGVVCLLGASLLGLPGPSPAADAPAAGAPEQFEGRVVDAGNAMARRSTAFITLHVDRYTTNEEVAGYLKVLHEQGENDLRLALEKVEVGWLKISNSLGYPVSIAREFMNPDGTRTIRIVTARQMALFELLRNTRSSDYPFGAIELKMPADGKEGEGRLLAALSIEFSDEGELELENLGTQPLRVMNMRREPAKPSKK